VNYVDFKMHGATIKNWVMKFKKLSINVLEFNFELGELIFYSHFPSLKICHPMQIHVFHLQLGSLCGFN